MKDLLKLSRKLDRTEEESEYLYNKIQGLVIEGRLSNQKLSKLFYILYPHINKVIDDLYFRFKDTVYTLDYGDLLTQSFFIFKNLVKRYNSTESKFLYYFKHVFKLNLFSYLIKENERLKKDMVHLSVNSEARDKRMSYKDPHFHDLLYKDASNSLYNIMTKLINETKTTIEKDFIYKVVCGNVTVADLARKYKLSYHAVYQVKKRILFKLAEYINTEDNFNYFIKCTKCTDNKMAYKFEILKKNS